MLTTSSLPSLAALDVNVCKNEQCKNLGVSNAAEYRLAPQTLNVPSLFCGACNSPQAPLQENDDIKALLTPDYQRYLQATLRSCPRCENPLRRYGSTARGKQRFQCTVCRGVFSRPALREADHELARLAELILSEKSLNQCAKTLGLTATSLQRKLKRLADLLDAASWQLGLAVAPAHLATLSAQFELTRGLGGAGVWGLFSAEPTSGFVWGQTLNHTSQSLSAHSLYRGGLVPPSLAHLPLSERVPKQSKRFWQRTHFEDLVYHRLPSPPAGSTARQCGHLLTPILTSHLHFQWLGLTSPAVSAHFLQHELSIRAGCLTAYAPQIQQHQCDLLYVEESALGNSANSSSAKLPPTRQGWWHNYWLHVPATTGTEEKMLGLLTEHQQPELQLEQYQTASLSSCRAYLQALQASSICRHKQPTVSASTFVILVRIFSHFYNYCQLQSDGLTPAQRAGIADKPLSPIELLVA